MTDVKRIDVAIAAYQREHGLTQDEFAKQVGMSEGALSKKRRGKSRFTLDEAVSLAKTLGMSLDSMVV